MMSFVPELFISSFSNWQMQRDCGQGQQGGDHLADRQALGGGRGWSAADVRLTIYLMEMERYVASTDLPGIEYRHTGEFRWPGHALWIGGWGRVQPGNRFMPCHVCVLACARYGCIVGMR